MSPDAAHQPSAEAAVLTLRRLNSAFAASNRAVGARLGIKDSDLAVLDALDQDGPQTPTELARRTRTHIATMTGILTRLERDGWIERRRTETDRRSIQIHARGVHRLTKIYARANQNLTQLLESWTPSQVSMLIHFLTDASDIANTFADQLSQEAASSDRHASESAGDLPSNS